MDENRYHYLVIGQSHNLMSGNTLTVNVRVQLPEELNPVNLNEVYAQLQGEVRLLVPDREAQQYSRVTVLSVVPLGKFSSTSLLRMRKEVANG